MTVRRRLWLIASLYTAALITPAVDFDQSFKLGFECLILVPWVCMFPEWWANPLLFLGWFLLARRRFSAACWCAAIAGHLALFTFLHFTLALPGFFLWLASIFALFISGLAGEERGKATRPEIINDPDFSPSRDRSEVADLRVSVGGRGQESGRIAGFCQIFPQVSRS
jgi:hypothetical protein